MRKKPWSIVVLAVLHWVSPIGNVFMNSWRFKVAPFEFFETLLSRPNWLHLGVLVILPMLSGVCIFVCRRWSYAVYISLMLIPFVYSFVRMNGDYQITNLIFVLGLYAINIILVGYFLLPNIRTIYFNPKVRWWQSAPRFQTDFEAKIRQNGELVGQGNIKNISLGGVFVEMPGSVDLKIPVEVEFASQGKKFSIQASPVFHRSAPPAGFGFKIDLDEAKKCGIRELVKELQKEGALILGQAPQPGDSFQAWLGRAWRSREAWLPTAKN